MKNMDIEVSLLFLGWGHLFLHHGVAGWSDNSVVLIIGLTSDEIRLCHS